MPQLRHVAIAACMAALHLSMSAQAQTVQCKVSAGQNAPVLQISIQREPWGATVNGQQRPIKPPERLPVRSPLPTFDVDNIQSPQEFAVRTQSQVGQLQNQAELFIASARLMGPQTLEFMTGGKKFNPADFLMGQNEPRLLAVRELTIYDFDPDKWGRGRLLEAWGIAGQLLWRGVTVHPGLIMLCQN